MPHRRAPYLALVVGCAAWGLSFPFGKIALGALAAPHVVFVRFVMAAVCFGALAIWKKTPLPRWRELPGLAWTGFLMVPAVFLLQFEGLARTSVTRAALIVGAFPVVMALAAVWQGAERPSRRVWMAIGASTLGVALTAGQPGAQGQAVGDVLVLASIATSALWVLATRRLLQRRDALFVTLWSVVLGTCWHGLIMLALDGWPPLDVEAGVWAALVGLGVVCTVVTYGLWNWSQQYVPAATAGVFVNLEPLVGAVVGVMWFHDPAGAATVVGGALIVGAALVVARG